MQLSRNDNLLQESLRLLRVQLLLDATCGSAAQHGARATSDLQKVFDATLLKLSNWIPGVLRCMEFASWCGIPIS